MKKFLFTVVVIMCLSLILGTAFCDDFTGKTTNELLELRLDIDKELLNQNGKIILPNGEYVGGRDIAVGGYNISFFKNRYTGGTIKVFIFPDSQSRTKYEDAYQDYKLKWTLAEEAIQSNSTVEVPVPDAFDGSQYYISKIEKTSGDGDSVYVYVGEGQVFYIEYEPDYFFATIEQSKGLFME